MPWFTLAIINIHVLWLLFLLTRQFLLQSEQRWAVLYLDNWHLLSLLKLLQISFPAWYCHFLLYKSTSFSIWNFSVLWVITKKFDRFLSTIVKYIHVGTLSFANILQNSVMFITDQSTKILWNFKWNADIKLNCLWYS